MEVVRRDMLAALSVWKSVQWAVYARMRQLFAAGVMVLGALHTCVVDLQWHLWSSISRGRLLKAWLGQCRRGFVIVAHSSLVGEMLLWPQVDWSKQSREKKWLKSDRIGMF